MDNISLLLHRNAHSSVDRVMYIKGEPVEVKIIDFPSIRQYYTYSCGASSVQSVMFYYGLDNRELEISKELGTDRRGTNTEPMINFFKKKGFKVYSGKADIQKLKVLVDHAIPSIVALQAWAEDDRVNLSKSYDDGHFVVVIGYTPDHIIFSDPSNIEDSFLTYNEMDSRWHDTEKDGKTKLEHFCIVPYGMVPKYNSSKLVHMD